MLSFFPVASWSLRIKFALCSGVLMFAFSVAFTTWTLHTVESDVRTSVVDAQLALVRSTADDIDAKIELRRDAVKTIALLLAQAAPAPGAAMDAFFRPRPVLQKMFDAVVVVDASGHVAHDMPSGSAELTVGSNMAERDFFKKILAGSAFVISSPFEATTGAAPCIAFAAPLRSRGGAITGALLGVLNPTHGNFLGDLSNVHIGKEGFFALVERSANPLFVLHRQHDLIMTPAPGGLSQPILASAIQGQEGTVEGMSTLGVESLRTYKPLRSVPWVLVAVYPTAEAFAGLGDKRREVLSVGCALFLLASCTAWLMTGWLLRPLNRLRILIGGHATGPGPQLEPASFGCAELADLVRAYNAQSAGRREFENLLKASEQHVREITDNMPASIAYIDKDERYVFANAGLLVQLGMAETTIGGKTLKAVRGNESYAEIAPHVARALRGEVVTFEEHEQVAKRKRHTQSQFIPDIGEHGEVRGFYAMTFDITALKDAQDRQARVEQRLRAITDNLPALIAHVDEHEHYDFLNATFRTWLGIDPATAIGRPVADVIDPKFYASFRENMARCMAGERQSFEVDAQTLLGPKSLQVQYLPDFAPDGAVTGFYTLTSDITELKEAQLRLSRLVRSDTLTGLHNRLQFEERLPLAIARCQRSELAMAVLFMDVDRFKQVNDGFGHAAGDLLLKEFAHRLKRCVRTTDTVARLGGDEFVLILEGLHQVSDATRVAQSILDEVRQPIDIGQSQVTVTVTTSIGIAFHAASDGIGMASEMLARADEALYAAKAAGRNGYHLSEPLKPLIAA